MAKLTIPVEYRLGVSKIRTLTEQGARDIRKALDAVSSARTTGETTPTVKAEDAALSAVTAVSQETLADQKKIAEALVTLYGVKSFREVSVEEFADEVCDAMESMSDQELRLPHSDRAEFRNKLLILLGSEDLGLAAKAHDLATEDERTFCHARIITDLRPVFGSKIEDGPRAMVVVHQLKLAYHGGNEKHLNFYVTLDADDLQTMRKVIDRAQAKEASLKSSTKSIRVLGASRESK